MHIIGFVQQETNFCFHRLKQNQIEKKLLIISVTSDSISGGSNFLHIMTSFNDRNVSYCSILLSVTGRITQGQTVSSETPEAILFFPILSHHKKQIGPNPQGLSNFR